MSEPSSLSIGDVSMPDYMRPVYANFVGVNHTPWDFRLTFAVIRTPSTPEEKQRAAQSGTVSPEAVADMIIPANLVHGLISALQTNFTRYLDSYGAPGLNPEGPGHPEDDETR